MDLDDALQTLFTPTQIDIIKKKYAGMQLTKTEKEYYSRNIKRKVAALTNPGVRRMAQMLRTL
jgi:hypothetical protein